MPWLVSTSRITLCSVSAVSLGSVSRGAIKQKSEPFRRPAIQSGWEIFRRLMVLPISLSTVSMVSRPKCWLRRARLPSLTNAREPLASASSDSSLAPSRAIKGPRSSSPVPDSISAASRCRDRRCDSFSSISRTRRASSFMARVTSANSVVEGSSVVMKRRSPMAWAWATTAFRGARIRRSMTLPSTPATNTATIKASNIFCAMAHSSS